MAERIALGPFPDKAMIDLIVRRAGAAGGGFAEEAARRLVDLAGPVPDDIQHLAWAAFEDARGSQAIGEVNVDTGMATIVERQAQLYGDLFAALPHGQRSVVAQLAVDPTAHPSSGEFVRRTGPANNTSACQALKALIDAQLVDQREDVYVVADPFWAAWLRRWTVG